MRRKASISLVRSPEQLRNEEQQAWVAEIARSNEDYDRSYVTLECESARLDRGVTRPRPASLHIVAEELEFAMARAQSLIDASREIRERSRAARNYALAVRARLVQVEVS